MKDRERAVQEIARGGGIVLVALFFTYLFSFIYQVLAAKYLTVDEYGLLSLGIVALGIGTTFSQLGLAQGAKRFVSYYISRNDVSRTKGTIIAAIAASVSFSALLALGLYIFSPYISLHVFRAAELSPVLRIFAFAIPPTTFIIVANELFFAFRKPVYRVVVETFMDKLVRVIILLIVILIGGSLLHVSIAYLAGIAIASVVAALLVYRLYSALARKSAKYSLHELFSFSLPLLFAAAIGETLRRFDKVLVGYFLSPEQVGIYNVAFSFADLLSVIMFAMMSLYYPVIAGLLARNKTKLISDMYSTVARLSLIGTLPLFIFYIIFGTDMISVLYKPQYVPGYASLLILSSGYLITVLLGPSIVNLEVHKRTKTILAITSAGVLLNLALDVLLIPHIGISGAAISTALSLAVIAIISYMTASKDTPIKLGTSQYWKFGLSALIAAAISFTLKRLYPAESLIPLLANAIILCIVYFASLFALRALTHEDKLVIATLEKAAGFKPMLSRLIR